MTGSPSLRVRCAGQLDRGGHRLRVLQHDDLSRLEVRSFACSSGSCTVTILCVPFGPLKVTWLLAGSTLMTSADTETWRPAIPGPAASRSVRLGFVPAGKNPSATDCM